MDYVGTLGVIMAAQVIGALWYGPLFGKLWMQEMNIDPTTVKVTAMPFVVSIVSNVVLCLIISNVYTLLKVVILQHALWVATVLWMATISLRIPHYAFGRKSMLLFLIDSAFDLLIISSAAAILFQRLQ